MTLRYFGLSVLLLSLLSLGCEREHRDCGGNYYLDPTVDRSMVQGVMDDWNTWVGREVVRITPDAQCRIQVANLPNSRDGWRDNITGDITLDPDADDAARTLRHELGHGLGMDHLPSGSGVMAAMYVDSTDWFTIGDWNEARRVGLIP